MSQRAGVGLIEERYIPSNQLTRVRAASDYAGLFSENTMPALRLLLTFSSRAVV